SCSRAYLHASLSLVAVGYLLLMYFVGAQPTHGNLVRNVEGGVLQSELKNITSVEITTTNGREKYTRRDLSWHNALSGFPLTKENSVELKKAITFMQTAAPVRVLRPEEFAAADDGRFGLGKGVLDIEFSTSAGTVLAVGFGNHANDGILRYMQVIGRPEIYLMSGFVGDAWEGVAYFDAATVQK
ncbi:MAG TPA: hypothetical protein DGR97_09600, partial [Gammaproteobacteria bacterium]|nr:hypothetical protein [Gammaproteobacteria bacterium]